ncbi:MAG: hypothetical protein WC916_04895 [Candidatus Woesearchaeota archaeon]
MEYRNIIIILALFLITFFISGCTSGGTEQTTKTPQCRDVQTSYESQEEYAKTEYYTETVPYTDQECEQKTLVYSVTNFIVESSVCNTQEEVCHKSYPVIGCTDKTVYCVDRDVICTLSLNNLDTERGSWTYTFSFFKLETNRVLTTATVSDWLYPQTSRTIRATGKITSKDEINTRYSCSYAATYEPTKQICRDVIKYKDVQKERQVTAYRPVTKYKTEQKCE